MYILAYTTVTAYWITITKHDIDIFKYTGR